MDQKSGKFKCSMDDYNAYPAVRGGQLVTLIQKSPAHYLWEIENQKPATPAMERGNRIHTAALEPKIFKEQMIVAPIFEGLTKDGKLTTSMAATSVKEKHEAWHMKHHGKIIMTQDQYDQVSGVLTSLSKKPRACQLMSDGHAEESFIWQDPETQIWCKSRPDFHRENHICVQLKTCQDASPEVFLARDVHKYGYHIRAAMELEALTAIYSRPYDEYIVIAVEEAPPYAVSIIKFGERTLQEGQELFYKGLRDLKKCQDTGIYPAYPDDIVYGDIPEYKFTREE